MIQIFSSRQQGAALAISLIFLLVLTILSIAAMSGSGLQERMAGGTREANLAFQAAESGLLTAENWIGRTLQNRPVPISICTTPCAASQVWAGSPPDRGDVTIDGTLTHLDLAYDWSAFNWINGLARTGDSLLLVNAEPRYIVQETGVSRDDFSGESSAITATRVYYYTVTARGVGRSDQHSAILQTVYARRF